MNDQPAILLCGHGTTDADAIAGFEAFVAQLRARLPYRRIAHGYLELAQPSFAETIEALHRDGIRDIVALPVLLFTAGHAKHDMPGVLNSIQSSLPNLRIRMGRPLGLTPEVVETACRVAAAAIPPGQSTADTMLLLAGRGTSEPDANGDAAKLARLVAERLGLGFATTAYIAVVPPKPADALALLEHLPFRHGLFMPAVFFDGMLYKQLTAELAAHQRQSAKQWRMAAPLASESPWIETFVARLAEVESGKVAMNRKPHAGHACAHPHHHAHHGCCGSHHHG